MATKRRRVAKKDVRSNAKTSSGDGKQRYFNLPQNVETWQPKKAGVYELNILPYEVKSDNHPDKASAGIEPGTLWYKYPFMVHHNIGAANESVVCPISIGKPCPICQERTRLAKENYDENEEAIKALRAQKYVAYNAIDPDDSEKVVIIAMSKGKFANALEQELSESGDENLNFFDVTDEGKTLKVRFSEASFEGRKYFEATRIDFVDRDEMDENETVERTVCLDEAFRVMSYDDLRKCWLQIDEDDERKRPSDEDEDEQPKGKRKKEPDDEDEQPKGKRKKPDDEDDEPKTRKGRKDKAPSFKKGQRVSFEDEDGKTIEGKIISITGDEIVVEDENGDEFDTSPDDLTPLDEKKPSNEDEQPKGKRKKPDDEDDEPKTKPKSAAKSEFSVGDRVQFKNRKGVMIVGKLTDIDGDDVTVEDDEGDDHFSELADLEPADGKKAKPKDEKPEFKVGSVVTWEDGDKKGKITKIHSSGEKAKVVDADDEEVWVAIEDLVLKK